MNWFAIHSKRFRESLAAASISELGIEVFLPMIQVEGLERLIIKRFSQPLFPGYFFARFSAETSLDLVESALGVLYVIKAGPSPIPVEDPVVAEIQIRVEPNGLIPLERRAPRPGDRVYVQEGPFAGMMGRVEAEQDNRKRVAILLETLWNAKVLIQSEWIEVEAGVLA